MKYFFCGVCGSGMSALAQIARLEGNSVSGSDRAFDKGENKEVNEKLKGMGIEIYPQDGSGVKRELDFFVVSTAVEETNPDYLKAKELGMKITHRSELLSDYIKKNKTIAVGGTSGKSTTTAMIWHILKECSMEPSIINGACINSLREMGLVGNAYKGKSEIMVIEADESDSTITNYSPEIGIILNITKDHKSIEEIKEIFSRFILNSKNIFINQDAPNCAEISKKSQNKNIIYFGKNPMKLEIDKIDFFSSEFNLNGYKFFLPLGGRHNIENAMASVSVCNFLGIDYKRISEALRTFSGTFRRANLIGKINNISVIDDYAHNPAKIEAALKTFLKSKRTIAIYQPHGFAPTRMFKNELINIFSNYLKESDIIIMPEIYYAGGNVIKDISSKDIIDELSKRGKNAYYFKNRKDILSFIRNISLEGDIILIMGARDNTLNDFAKEIYEILTQR